MIKWSDIPSRFHPTGYTRRTKQLLMAGSDVLLLLASGWLAYALRLGSDFRPTADQWLLIGAAPLIALPVFVKLGLYRSVIRYIGEQALWAVVKAMTLAALLWTSLAFVTQATGAMGLPRSVPVLYGLLGMGLIGGSRFAARWLLWTPVRRQFPGGQVLIYGAGNAGRQLAASLRAGHDLFPAGFLDDDGGLQGKDVDGLRVYAPGQLRELIARFGVRDVIVTLPSASAARRREVVQFLEQYPVRVRILPAVSDIANGRLLVNMVREVDIGDLLGRDPVPADPDLLGCNVTDKVVLVSGAGGSIGSELCRQIAALEPARLVLLDQSEHALYQIERELAGCMALKPVTCLGSVSDEAHMFRLLCKHGVQTVYHAAAYKHVPMVEDNVVEGVANNVLGTLALGRAALKTGVETFVLVSTDKAVRPTSVMGASKRWAELVVQDLARQADMAGRGQRFCAVRFGNVLGSSGSVIPLFKDQIDKGGPVTLTHPEMTRYFMSIHEAVQLIIQAGSMAEGGEVFLLDMGEPVKIMDLAHDMVRLAGLKVRDAAHPDGDIEVTIVGMRPGEKLHEELLIDWEKSSNTAHPKIRKGLEPGLAADVFMEHLGRLQAAVEAQSESGVKSILMGSIERVPALRLVASNAREFDQVSGL